MDICINEQNLRIEDVAQLRACIEDFQQARHGEVDLNVEDDIARGDFFGLTLLVNGDRASLAYYRYYADTGLVSVDSTYSGPPDAKVEFTLGNGQVDAFPAAWTIGTEEAFRALEYTFLHQAPAPWVTWRNSEELGFDLQHTTDQERQ